MPVWTLVHDQLSWSRPAQGQLKDSSFSVEDLVNYDEYLCENYPHKGDEEDAAQNKNLYADRVLSFARAGGAGAKFKNLQEKMLKALNLPKGAKEELNYPHDIIEKIQNGVPLFEEEDKNLNDTEPNEDGDFEDEGKQKKESLTDE